MTSLAPSPPPHLHFLLPWALWVWPLDILQTPYSRCCGVPPRAPLQDPGAHCPSLGVLAANGSQPNTSLWLKAAVSPNVIPPFLGQRASSDWLMQGCKAWSPFLSLVCPSSRAPTGSAEASVAIVVHFCFSRCPGLFFSLLLKVLSSPPTKEPSVHKFLSQSLFPA